MYTYLWALYGREVKRFQKIWMDTVFSPIVSIVLYLGVFGIVAAGRSVEGVSYVSFIYTGLLTMMVINSSFSNPSFALVIAKNVGNIIDLQLIPVKPWRIGIAYALAALTRSLLTLLVALAATIWFIPGLSFHSPVYLLLGLFFTGLEFGMLGVIVGFVAKGFEALTFITTFLMQPMIFLAGVFYPISNLPAPWSTISMFNPIHHNINLLRFAVTGYHDASPLLSLSVIMGVSVLFFIGMFFITRKSIKV